MNALDAETGLPTTHIPVEPLGTVAAVYLSINNSDLMIELGSTELATHIVDDQQETPNRARAKAMLPDVAAVLRKVADQLDGGLTPSPLVRGRHFAPYGSSNALCGEDVRPAPDMITGEYSDDRYTVQRARTTCAECLALMDPTVSEEVR
jgi:hypothetical protein